jgi:hypothetical protein
MKKPTYTPPSRDPNMAPVFGVMIVGEKVNSYSPVYCTVDNNMRICERRREQFTKYEVPSTLRMCIILHNPDKIGQPNFFMPVHDPEKPELVQYILDMIHTQKEQHAETVRNTAQPVRTHDEVQE